MENEAAVDDKYLHYVFNTFSGILVQINSDTTKLMLSSMNKLLADQNVKANLKSLFPYLYTAGFLALVGKDVNKENMKSALNAIDVLPDERLIDVVLSTNVKNNVTYLYIIYYLAVLGKTPNQNEIFKLAKVIGISEDKIALQDAMDMYNRKTL